MWCATGICSGSTFVSIFINDFPKLSSKLSFYLFADDTNIYFESDNLDDLRKVVNKELKQVKKWLDANKLALNIEKTKFVIFHSVQNSLIESPSIKIGNQHVRQAMSNFLAFSWISISAGITIYVNFL